MENETTNSKIVSTRQSMNNSSAIVQSRVEVISHLLPPIKKNVEVVYYIQFDYFSKTLGIFSFQESFLFESLNEN